MTTLAVDNAAADIPHSTGVPGSYAHATGKVVKRLIDVVLSCALLVVALPVIGVLALGVKMTSPGPAFFRQVRVGRSGRPFHIVKLRTMVIDAEAQLTNDHPLRALYLENGYKVPPNLDPRLTRLGNFLRRASLDELPQLFNVIRGDMSLVGPRPVLPAELEGQRQLKGVYERVRPGITGYWQVNGRSAVVADDRVELDRYYIENWTVWLDIKILVRTVAAVATCSGAH